jgi:hypothetical protein
VLTYYLWLITLGLKGCLVGLSLRRGLFARFPGFFSYLTLSTSLGFLRLYTYTFSRSAHLELYWWTQFLILASEFIVIWEIFSLSLRHYPGVRKFARMSVTAAFSLVAVQFIASSLTGQFAKGVMGLERNMRAVEVALLIPLVLLAMYYGLRLGRNLTGLILGYGLYTTSNMVALYLHTALGPGSQIWLNPFRGMCEIFTVLIWLTALRTFYPAPAPAAQLLEEDYAAVAARTSQLIARARAQIARMLAI